MRWWKWRGKIFHMVLACSAWQRKLVVCCQIPSAKFVKGRKTSLGWGKTLSSNSSVSPPLLNDSAPLALCFSPLYIFWGRGTGKRSTCRATNCVSVPALGASLAQPQWERGLAILANTDSPGSTGVQAVPQQSPWSPHEWCASTSVPIA